MEVDVVTRTIVTSEMTERDDLAAAALRDPGRSGNRARRYSEEGRKDNILAAVILIGGIPDGPVFLQAAKQAPKVPGAEHGAIPAFTGSRHHGVHQRVVMVPLHHVCFNELGHQAPAEIQSTVMASQ